MVKSTSTIPYKGCDAWIQGTVNPRYNQPLYNEPSIKRTIFISCLNFFGPFQIIWVNFTLTILIYSPILFPPLKSILNLNNLDKFTSDYMKEPNNYEIIKCLPTKNSFYEKFLLHTWFWIDILFYSIIPFLIKGFCTIVIMIKLRRINKSYMNHLEIYNLNRKLYMRKLRKNSQISLMLVSSNLYFLFTMVIFWLWFLFKSNIEKESVQSSLRQSFVYMLLYTNNAFDFVFYGMSSQKYRKEFRKLFFGRSQHAASEIKNKTTWEIHL